MKRFVILICWKSIIPTLDIRDSEKKELEGEAAFMTAYVYFYLAEKIWWSTADQRNCRSMIRPIRELWWFHVAQSMIHGIM